MNVNLQSAHRMKTNKPVAQSIPTQEATKKIAILTGENFCVSDKTASYSTRTGTTTVSASVLAGSRLSIKSSFIA